MAETDFNGKVVVITGASSGIGKGAALKFASAGANVVLAARRGELLEELAQECQASGGNALAVTTDVSKEADVINLTQKAVSTFGRIDVWINNAGSGTIGRFEEIPMAEHVQVIETDLLGTMYGSYQALNQFRKQGGGNLINVASVIGKIPAPYFASYAAAKHGVVGLSGALRQELNVNQVKAIFVCTVMPMSMDTPFFEHAAAHTGHKIEPIPPIYEPQQVIDALFHVAQHPKDETTVGGFDGPGSVLTHQLAPGLMEFMMGKLTHHIEMDDAPLAPETPGSVQQPVAAGTEVSGGWKS